MRIAFDIDDTLYKLVKDESPSPIAGVGAICACGMHIKQVKDEGLMSIAHALILNGDDVFLWSAGGVKYVENWIKRWAPAWEGLVKIIPKEKGHDIDICFDDQEVDLAKTVLRIKREHAGHWDGGYGTGIVNLLPHA